MTLREYWMNVLSLMTLAELHQRRDGHARALLRPTSEAAEAFSAAYAAANDAERAEACVPGWATRAA